MATQQDYLDQDTQALVPVATYQTPRVQGFLMPLGDIAQARAAIETYEQLKTAIVRPDDIQKIQGRDFLKKSFWRRVAACFGLSLELVSEDRLILDGKLAYRATYRAIAPNGRIMDGDGMCMQGEKGQMIEHNIRAIAHTRAKNRAISDLVGGGEVSAEEMQDYRDENEPPTPQPVKKSQWNALEDADVKVIFHQLNKDDDQRREIMTAIFNDMRADGEVWNKPNVMKRLREVQASANALYDLPVGERGN